MNAIPIPPEELHDALAEAHWDLYKEANGIRPRWVNYSAMSTAELERAVLSLQEEAREAAEEWAAIEARLEAEARQEAEEAAREAVKRHEERWMDQAAAMGAAGW